MLAPVGTEQDDGWPGPHPDDPAFMAGIPEDDAADREAFDESIEVERRSLEGTPGPSGSLVDEPPPALLHRMYTEAATGALLLTHADVKKIVYLRDGYPVAVKSNVIGECLGKILTWEGLITADQYRRSLWDMKETGVRQGTALVRMGALTHEQLAMGLELQLRFKLCETFSWTDGDYRLWPGVSAPYESVPLSLSPAGLVYEGVRSFVPQPRLLAALKPHVQQYLRPTEDPFFRFQELVVPEEAEALLAKIDGTAKTGDLMRASTLKVQEVAALLHALLLTRIVVASDEPASLASPLFDPDLHPDVPTERSAPGGARRRVELARLVARLRSASPYDVLGLADGASRDEVVRAYAERAMERHPDRQYANTGSGIRELAGTALRLTAEAHAAVVGATGAPARPEGADDAIDARVRNIVQAEVHHQRGLELLDEGKGAEAVAELGRAVAACEEEGDFRASLAWAIFQNGLDTSAAEQALLHLDVAVVRSPGLVRAHVYRGHVLRFMERKEDAARAFEEALRRDPENDEAMSELERIRETAIYREEG
jgi:hypothetical protein